MLQKKRNIILLSLLFMSGSIVFLQKITIPKVYGQTEQVYKDKTSTTHVLAAATTPTPTPTGGTAIALTVYEHGIGDSGDNSDPSDASLSNKNPSNVQINVSVEIFTTNNQLIAGGGGIVTYNTSTGAYTGDLPIQQGFPSGQYLLSIKTDSHLREQVPGIQTITAGKDNTISPVTLIAGDINNDNVVNILDYNILMGCYSDLKPAVSCTADQKTASDLNDDGSVNEIDYNLFIRELSNQTGAQ